MDLIRRKIVFSGAAGAGALVLAGSPLKWLGKNNENQDHFFVLISVEGGMDVTLGLDPQIRPSSDYAIEYRPDQINRVGSKKEFLLGPAAKALIPFADEMSVINGISMKQNAGHDSLRASMTKGCNFDPGKNANTIEMAGEIAEGFTPGLPEFHCAVDSSPENAIVSAFSNRKSSWGMISLDQFDLDTHVAHEKNHLREQTKAWQRVADIFKLFRGRKHANGTLFDHTTFYVVSECSRDVVLNRAGGKDHNTLTNSALLAGKGVSGGTVIGSSKLGHEFGKPVHRANPMPGKGFLTPEKVAKSVANMFDRRIS